MSKLPFGIPGLDQDYGGIPKGSFVLLAGEVDSGVDEYAYTSASMVNMAATNPERFARLNDAEVSPEDVPDETHYVSLERDKEVISRRTQSAISDRQYEALTRRTRFADFSDDYLGAMPGHTSTSSSGEEYEQILEDLKEYLEENADDSIVVIDSLTSLFKATEFGLDRSDVLSFLTWLSEASWDWDGLVYVLYHATEDAVREDEVLASTPDGVLYFKIGEIGGGLHRGMHLGSFRGTFSQAQDKICVYDVKIGARGFEVSTVNEII